MNETTCLSPQSTSVEEPRVLDRDEDVASKRPEKEGIQRILKAAKDEFCRAGLAGAKLETIAKRAGVSKQLIHHYYGTKPGLYNAVVSETSSAAIEELSRLRYEDYSPEKGLRLFLHGIFDLYIRFPFMAGMVIDCNLQDVEVLPECRQLILRSPLLMERLAGVIERGQQQGVFKTPLNFPATISAAVLMTSGCFTGGKGVSMLVPFDFADDENIQFWRDYSVDFVLSALRP